MSIFATRLRSLRAEYNISMKTLAKHINATDTAVSNWENNINEPKISYVISIARTIYWVWMKKRTQKRSKHFPFVILSGALAQSKNPLGKPLTQWDLSTTLKVTVPPRHALRHIIENFTLRCANLRALPSGRVTVTAFPVGPLDTLGVTG